MDTPNKNKKEEFKDTKRDREEWKGKTLKSVLNLSIVTNYVLHNMGFIIWLCFLGVLYIGNTYHAETIARAIEKNKREVKDLRAESITTAAELMEYSRQSRVLQTIKEKDMELEQSVEPPYKVE